MQDLKDKNTEVVGITFSTPEDLKTWADEMDVTAELLCDADRSIAMAYGAAETADQEKATRASVLIGPDGKVVKTYTKPDPEQHPDEVLEDLS
ncbi:MAG: redoxin domain-containing protein [Rhodospirillaceae bacterium]|nr:redoxin domain-containing protein [Rhodospirillales bacterium]MBT3905045.1 redoxin domain-containing protein [Rhodospirillaceae bacterium]MBT4703069.1 redoxin domain-containing protein [Rhodospirillaceae bacterium]MBT5034228.1 redoxin domain-containing protein [Rhodospirillaceae bacterium]MBT6220643.1 redoxin domain-containing protein [Rhodospirillaceae bacterium]